MIRRETGVFTLIGLLLLCTAVYAVAAEPIIVDHTSTNLAMVPKSAIEQARSSLHIAYGHTSHGSQITEGMTRLVTFPNAPYGGSLYVWNNGGTNGALDLHDYAMAGDLGDPDRISWADRTRTYLNANPDVNVIIWSWCGQVSTATEADISTYLSLMSQLENEYPDVKFVYMTGHLDGSGTTGNLNIRNQQIRSYCLANNKILYDFADIESYDPDGNGYLAFGANDNCDYYANGQQHNWATEWQNAHTLNVDWYQCSPAHTQPLNGNLKAYAAWHLWARLAGWNGGTGPQVPDTDFEANTTGGNPPLVVSFNDRSTGNPDSWDWDFGDGTPKSGARNPVHTFSSVGSYTITLTVSNNAGSNTEQKEGYITVRSAPINPPVAGFSGTPQTGTAPLTVMFTDTSSGTVDSREWNFGDGTPVSTGQNPSHVYTAKGNYTVTLTVTNAAGSDTEQANEYIRVQESTPPVYTVPAVSARTEGSTVVLKWNAISDTGFQGYKVVISKNNPNPAYPADGYLFWITDRNTVTASIDNQTRYNGGDFGGYLVPGESYYFSVTAVYNDARVPGNAVRLVFPGGPVPGLDADFIGSPLRGTAPLTVIFTDTSSGTVNSLQWNFGDGSPVSTERNPSHTYTVKGNYTVNLTVSGPEGSDSEIKTDYIRVDEGMPAQLPKAQFFANRTHVVVPATVLFKDNSRNAESWEWDFNGDGVTDATGSGPHTFVYTTPGSYHATLNVSNAAGSSSVSKVIRAVYPKPPQAHFQVKKTSTLVYTFYDTSQGVITSREWDFDGDGTVDSREKGPVAFTYPQKGSYRASLLVEDAYGRTSQYTKKVQVR